MKMAIRKLVFCVFLHYQVQMSDLSHAALICFKKINSEVIAYLYHFDSS